MAIINYPNRIYKTVVPAIDRELAKRNPQTVSGYQEISVNPLDVTISTNSDWQIDSISFEFSNANPKNYSAKSKRGRRVVTNFNDYLWFQIPTTNPQRIILDQGFYTGTELAAQLEAQLDANDAFVGFGITFTVAYDPNTGLFTITPSAGTLRYLNVNDAQTLRTRDSIAGHLFGLTENTDFAATVQTDTEVYGLNSEVAFINETASAVTEHYHDDLHTMSIDQSLLLETNAGVGVVVNYTVVYEEMV